MSASPIKLIYIAGYERSGSTLLAKVLGELPETIAPGELRNIWQRSYIDNIVCGCGAPFDRCPFWSEVTSHAFGGAANVRPHEVLASRERARHLPAMLLPGSERWLSRRFRTYVATLDSLYRAVAAVSGCRIIVDSSKSPSYSFLLRLVPALDVYVVHLVRDPRGIQHSLLKRRHGGHPRYRNHSVIRSALSWDAKNLTHELLAMRHRERYLRVRYEDFVADPAGTLAAVRGLIGEPRLALPRIDDGAIEFSPNHIMGGSPSRREVGQVALRPDDAWRREMDARSRTTVTRFTLPLLRRYGYPRGSARAA